jgi:hypothetical protein
MTAFGAFGSERRPLITLPIAAAGVLSPGIVCATIPLPVVRMNHHVRVWRIVIPLHRMPAGRAGLIADDGRRGAVALNRYRSSASRRARRRCLSGGWRCGWERRNGCGGQCGNQEAFHRKPLWLDPPDPLDHAAPTLGFSPLFQARIDCLPALVARAPDPKLSPCTAVGVFIASSPGLGGSLATAPGLTDSGLPDEHERAFHGHGGHDEPEMVGVAARPDNGCGSYRTLASPWRERARRRSGCSTTRN